MPAPAPLPFPHEPDTRAPASSLRVRPHRLRGGFPAEIRQRTRLAAIVGLGGFGAGLAVNYLMAYLEGVSFTSPVMVTANGLAVGGIALSGLFYWIARDPRVSPDMLSDVALFFEVGGAFLIGAMEQWVPWPAEIPRYGVSWIAVWVAFFPFLANSTPGKTVLASMASASMGPLAFLFAVAGGRAVPDLHGLLHLFLPNYVVAVLTLVPAISLYKMRRQLEEARELGSYRLIEPLGRGGMGEVWLAEHRMLARPSAIKLIRGDALGAGATPTMLRRFEREARATAQLRSPHTVALYDFGTTDHGVFYYVMELLDGFDLELLVQRHGAQPVERVVHFLLHACESLEEAHAAGLVHRDVKPANLYACRLASRVDHLKVLDFGLVTHEAARETRLTRTDVATGTPAYLPPEMLRGEPVDGRADLYSLGCVAYYLLSGRLVFPATSPVEAAIHHLQTAPPKASDHAGVLLPPELDDALLRCLEKQPAARFATAARLHDALSRLGVASGWTPERAAEWWERNGPAPRTPRPGARADGNDADSAKPERSEMPTAGV